MSFPIYTVNAFTLKDQTFSGNPAAVCILEFDNDISDDIKQKIATQMNVSNTAFVAKAWNRGSKLVENTYTVRWFTPKHEVELCGHASLGSASVIFERSSNSYIKFETKFRGILEAIVNRDEQSITLDFPVNDCQPLEDIHNEWISEIIKHTLGPNLTEDVVQEVQYSSGTKKLLMRLKDRPEMEEIIHKITPNPIELLKVNTNDLVKGVIVTQKGEKVHFLSRYFSPWNGINEDPVCGAAHTVLTPFWMRQYKNSGVIVDELVGHQCSQRGGKIVCKIFGQRVQLTGNYKLVIKGNLKI